MSFLSRFKKMDLYRDIPKDLTEQTLTGAIVSSIGMLLIAYLFFTEFMTYLTVVNVSEMFVDSHIDTGNDHAMIQINMNITVPNIPCAVVSVDAQDIMGSHVIDVGGKLHKTRLRNIDAGGAVIGPFDEKTDVNTMIGEGCRIDGNMIVKRVPGNFHVSAHAHANLLHTFFKGVPMNVTHYIHDMSFGELIDVDDFGDANVNPLKGTNKIATPVEGSHDPNNVKSYEYYLKIVPTQFQRLNGDVEDSYQFVANSNEVVGRYRLPAVYFRYDMSPITVKFTQNRPSLAHFLVQICAIIGGVFTVLGLFNSIVNSTLSIMLKKASVGKLG